MPYKNLPESEWGKMDRCVEQVMGKQPDLEKSNAIAICYTSITGKEYTPALSIEPVGAQYRVFDANSGETLKQVNTAREAAEWQAQYRPPVVPTLKGNEQEPIETRPGLIDRLVAALKVGRRNSSTDEGRLQQIHDLAVENGAQCPYILKQANGSYRWILLSTNSYQDRDGEIVSQQAQEADVERMNQTGNFGPLRLWHLGYPDVTNKEAGPGIDVGVCDYAQMFGRIRVESGTFTDNRVGAAIKQHSDKWAGSIGFFHPLDQPDREGVYHDSVTFERSLLPQAFASNPLTPLAAILKEQAMTTKEEKVQQLTDLLGDPALADTVLKQAEATEKAAIERGLKYKATDEPPAKEETPAKEAAETPQKEEEEAAAPDYEAMAKGLAPFIEKMIETKMAGTAKEYTEKSASLTSAITALDSSLKETRKIVDALNADVPKGVKRHLASESPETIAPDGKYKGMETPAPDPLGTIFSWLAQPVGVPPVQTTPEK